MPSRHSPYRIRFLISVFIPNTRVVVRPIGVCPLISIPGIGEGATAKAKWSAHRSVRGLNNVMVCPVSGSIPLRFGPFFKLHAPHASAKLSNCVSPPVLLGDDMLNDDMLNMERPSKCRLREFGNTRKAQNCDDGSRSRDRSPWLLQRLSSFRLPQREQITDVDIRLQLGLFSLGQRSLVRFAA